MKGLHEQYVALVEKRDNPSLTWEDFADIRFEATGIKESAETLRKGAKLFYEYLNAGWISPPVESTFTTSTSYDDEEDIDLREMQLQRYELEKEKIKVRDERNELRRIIREEARKESFAEQVIRSINEVNFPPLSFDWSRNEEHYCGDNDLIISMTDLHVGIDIDNHFNRFNKEVFSKRLTTYVHKIVEIQKRHNSQRAHVVLSELISGLIHTTLRIENNQNVIQQFLTVVNYLACTLAELSYSFDEVNVYICPGNHSRVNANKNEAFKGENFDHLVLPFLEAKLQNYENIYCHYNHIEESIAMFNVRGQLVMAAHGDKDSPANVVPRFTMMAGKIPDIVWLGHRHYNAMSTVNNTVIVQSGCMSGMDNYCLDQRLINKPSQTVCVVSASGMDCLYNVTFDE